MVSTALIRNSNKNRYKKVGGTTLFYKGSAKQTTVDFIRYIMKDIISIGTTELIEYLKEKFGIKLDKEKMMQFIKKSDMYYDQYTMKLYITEDAYYEENLWLDQQMNTFIQNASIMKRKAFSIICKKNE